MDRLLIYGSKECMGWEDVQELIRSLKQDTGFRADIVIRDPFEHQDEFREKGLVICPSYLYQDELIAVGVPTAEELKNKINQKMH